MEILLDIHSAHFVFIYIGHAFSWHSLAYKMSFIYSSFHTFFQLEGASPPTSLSQSLLMHCGLIAVWYMAHSIQSLPLHNFCIIHWCMHEEPQYRNRMCMYHTKGKPPPPPPPPQKKNPPMQNYKTRAVKMDFILGSDTEIS